MLNKCTNPACGEPFKHLDQGRLFRLSCERTSPTAEVQEPEYFWLCRQCSGTLTLRLDDAAKVRAVIAKDEVSHSRAGGHFIALDRKQGFMLSALLFFASPKFDWESAPHARAAFAR